MAAARKVSAAQSRTLWPSAEKRCGELADGGGLAGAVDADDEDDGGRLGDAGHGTLGGLEDFEQVFANQAAQFGGVVDELAVHALADSFEDFGGGADADVGGDEGVFEFFEQVGVDFLAAGEGVFHAVDETGAGFFDAGLEAVEQVRFLRDGAE